MKIKVVNQRLYLEPPKTAEGTRKYLRAEFSFSEEWEGTVKTAFFRGANGNTYSQLLENDACTVPAEVLAVHGRVGVSVSGTLGETVITTDIKSFSLPATLSGGTPSDPEPTLWQEVLDKFEKVSEVEEKVTELKSEIATKITAPENPEVGKAFKIKSVNDDGTFIGEWADCANLDVRINGESIVQNGVAEIPLAAKTKKAGLVTIDEYATSGGIARANVSTGLIRIQPASKSNIDARNNSHCPIVPNSSLDYAVKAAMCDGKGAVWTAKEQAAARERMGAESSDWEDVITYITSSEEEECTTCYIDFEHTYRKIYVLIDESAIKGTTYMSVRFGVIGKNKLHNVALLANTRPAFNIKQKYKTFSAEVMNTADISYRYTASSSPQLYSYCENPFIGRVGTPSITAVDASAIGGIIWYGKMYAGTRIVVKGVRA